MTRPTQKPLPSSSVSSPTLPRRFSIEETYHLASVARRKSLDSTRTDLRSKLGHAAMLEACEHVIRTSPPPSPLRISTTPAVASPAATKSLPRLSLDSQPRSQRDEVDEYGFPYDSEYDADEDELNLSRTASRRH